MENNIVGNELLSLDKLKEIVYFESIGNFTKTYNRNGKELLIEGTLNRLEEALPGRKFFKINETTIINADYLKKINVLSNNNVLLQDGIELFIDKQKYRDLIQFLRIEFSVW